MPFSLAVHGGTLGTIDNQDPQLAVIRQVLADGRQRLQQGDRAIDVVQAAVRQLEDSGLLNAGKGSKANAAGFDTLETTRRIPWPVDTNTTFPSTSSEAFDCRTRARSPASGTPRSSGRQ